MFGNFWGNQNTYKKQASYWWDLVLSLTPNFGTRVKHGPDLINFLRVVNIKHRQIPAFCVWCQTGCNLCMTVINNCTKWHCFGIFFLRLDTKVLVLFSVMFRVLGCLCLCSSADRYGGTSGVSPCWTWPSPDQAEAESQRCCLIQGCYLLYPQGVWCLWPLGVGISSPTFDI